MILVIEVRQTEEFSGWLRRLRDANAVARIAGRIRRMEMGNPGDSRSVGQGVLEMRIDYGPGYESTTCIAEHILSSWYVAAISARNGRTSKRL